MSEHEKMIHRSATFLLTPNQIVSASASSRGSDDELSNRLLLNEYTAGLLLDDEMQNDWNDPVLPEVGSKSDGQSRVQDQGSCLASRPWQSRQLQLYAYSISSSTADANIGQATYFLFFLLRSKITGVPYADVKHRACSQPYRSLWPLLLDRFPPNLHTQSLPTNDWCRIGISSPPAIPHALRHRPRLPRRPPASSGRTTAHRHSTIHTHPPAPISVPLPLPFHFSLALHFAVPHVSFALPVPKMVSITTVAIAAVSGSVVLAGRVEVAVSRKIDSALCVSTVRYSTVATIESQYIVSENHQRSRCERSDSRNRQSYHLA